jgi:hypothetical protein
MTLADFARGLNLTPRQALAIALWHQCQSVALRDLSWRLISNWPRVTTYHAIRRAIASARRVPPRRVTRDGLAALAIHYDDVATARRLTAETRKDRRCRKLTSPKRSSVH